MLGPILPSLAARWGLNDEQAGHLFAAQFLGAIAGTLVSSRLVTRFGYRAVLVAGYALMAMGVALTPTTGSAAVACYGFGLGIVIPVSNLLIAAWNPTRRAAALNLLNLAWGVGAVIAPQLISAFLPTGGFGLLMTGLAGALCLTSAACAVSGWEAESTSPATPVGGNGIGHPMLWRTCVLLFLYVGTENGISGWIPSYLLRAGSVSGASIAAAQSGFWGAILLGRMFAPLLLRKVAAQRLVLAAVCTATVGAAVFLAANHAAVMFGGVLLAGVGLSIVFPTAIAIFTGSLGADAVRWNPLIFVCASLGGAAIPWMAGFVSTRFHDLRTGMFTPLAAVATMVLVQSRICALLARRQLEDRF